MDATRCAVMSLLLAVALLNSGCAGGGGTHDDLTGHSTVPTNLAKTSPSGFPAAATGFYSGDMVLPNQTVASGLISFTVNSAGVVDSGSFQTGDGFSTSWNSAQTWPAGNPGVDGVHFETSDTLNGASELFQGNFNTVDGIWRGTWGRGAGYDALTPVTGTSSSWIATFKSPAAAKRAPASALTLQGQLFIGPGQGAPFQMGVKVYDDASAVVTGTTTDGRSIMIVGKQVVSPLVRSVRRAP